MGIFDSQAYQRASGQEQTGLFDAAFKNYDAASNGRPNRKARTQPISLPTMDSAAYTDAMGGFTNIDRFGVPMEEPYVVGGNKVAGDVPVPAVGGTSYYTEKIPVGIDEGTMVPGLAGSRVNEVGSMYRGVPGSGTPAEVALDNGFADAGPLVPFGRGQVTSPKQAKLDEYAVAGGGPVAAAVADPRTKTTKTDVRKAASKPRTKSGKKAKAKATQRVQAGVKQEAKKFATVDPLNIFGNKNGVNPFNPANKGSNRFSGGDVRISDRSAPGGRGAYGYNDEILSMF